MAHKQVLLRDDIDNLGARGEIVRVKAGYARNYLLPRNLAVEATTNNVRQIEGERAALAKREAKERSSAELQADQLRSLTLKFERKVGEAGVLYGSVTSMDIAHELKEQGYEIDRRRIVLREPIKRFGNYAVPVRLHRDVTVELPVNVLGEGGVEVDVAALEAEAGVEITTAPKAPTVTEPSAEASVETAVPEPATSDAVAETSEVAETDE
jgi:large subunit ribosomal protein L9